MPSYTSWLPKDELKTPLVGMMRWVCLGFTSAITMTLATSSAASESRESLDSRQSVISDIPIAETEDSEYLIAMRPERNIEAILQDTFNEAVRSGTASALIKFIWHNPDHPLADKARRMLEEHSYPPARKTQSDWVDSKIVEFDAARRSGPDALREFIARYPDHPLAAEARRMLSK
jgi:hypothetical protein